MVALEMLIAITPKCSINSSSLDAFIKVINWILGYLSIFLNDGTEK